MSDFQNPGFIRKVRAHYKVGPMPIPNSTCEFLSRDETNMRFIGRSGTPFSISFDLLDKSLTRLKTKGTLRILWIEMQGNRNSKAPRVIKSLIEQFTKK